MPNLTIYFNKGCPYCQELIKLLISKDYPDITLVPGITAIETNDPRYKTAKIVYQYTTVPLIISPSGVNLRGYDDNALKIRQLGPTEWIKRSLLL